MSRSYYDQRDSSARLAEALMGAGWTVHGYSEDKSDTMTDYWHPASWMGGVAWKGPLTLVCSFRAAAPATEVFERVQRTAPCESCGGDGLAKSGWTLTAARAAPGEFNRQRLVRQYGEAAVASGRVSMGLPDVVSPLMFGDGGEEKCHVCGGTGKRYLPEERGGLRYTVPRHHANPDRSHWHLERDGAIVRSGWLRKEWGERDSAELAAFVRELEAPAGAGYATAIARAEVDAPTLRRNEARGGLEVIFPAKPAQPVIDGLKAMGFRWSRQQGLWWARYSAAIASKAAQLLGVDAPASSGPADPALAHMIQAQEEARFDDFAARCL